MREREKRQSSLNSEKTDVFASVVPSQSSFQPCQQPGSNWTLSPENQELGLFPLLLFGKQEGRKVMILWPIHTSAAAYFAAGFASLAYTRFHRIHEWGCVPVWFRLMM